MLHQLTPTILIPEARHVSTEAMTHDNLGSVLDEDKVHNKG